MGGLNNPNSQEYQRARNKDPFVSAWDYYFPSDKERIQREKIRGYEQEIEELNDSGLSGSQRAIKQEEIKNKYGMDLGGSRSIKFAVAEHNTNPLTDNYSPLDPDKPDKPKSLKETWEEMFPVMLDYREKLGQQEVNQQTQLTRVSGEEQRKGFNTQANNAINLAKAQGLISQDLVDKEGKVKTNLIREEGRVKGQLIDKEGGWNYRTASLQEQGANYRANLGSTDRRMGYLFEDKLRTMEDQTRKLLGMADFHLGAKDANTRRLATILG